MQSTIEYECIDNDNEIQVVIKDGRIDKIVINSNLLRLWQLVSFDDLEAAIKLAKDEIAEQNRNELKLS